MRKLITPEVRARTDILRRQSVTPRMPLATMFEVEQYFGIVGHELLAVLKIPTTETKVGLLKRGESTEMFVFRNPEPGVPSLGESAKKWIAHWDPRPLARGTIEVIGSAGFDTLQNFRLGDLKNAGNTLGRICMPGDSMTIGRYTEAVSDMGQSTSREHVILQVTPDQVTFTDTSINSTTITYVQ